MRMKGLCSHSCATVVGSEWPGWISVAGSSSISVPMIESLSA